MIGLIEPTVDRIGELQRTVSASRLNLWLTCRLKFYFRYVLKLTKPKTAALHFGSVVHLVLQQWSLSRWRKQPFELARLRAVFDAGWLEQGSPIDWDGEEQAQKELAWSVLERYFTDTPIRANEIPEAVEVSVEADLTSHSLGQKKYRLIYFFWLHAKNPILAFFRVRKCFDASFTTIALSVFFLQKTVLYQLSITVRT